MLCPLFIDFILIQKKISAILPCPNVKYAEDRLLTLAF